MISSNLIELDDEPMIEIRHFEKEDSKTNPRNQKSLNLTLISQRNQRLNKGENKNREIMKLRTKFNQITILKQN